jgi:ankyrin repeat protein
MTALHFALAYRHPETAVWLLEQGANPRAANNDGLTPLHYAARQGFPELIDRLVEHGAEINARTRTGVTSLFYASGAGHTETTLKLLELGADTELDNEYGRTPLLNVARESGKDEMARVLIEHGANINATDSFGTSSINLAAWRGFSGIVNLLLDQQAEIPLTGMESQRLVICAAERGLERLMHLLITRGVDLAIRTERGGNLLHAAAMGGSAEIVRLLLSRGLQVDSADVYGWQPLHYAVSKGRTAAVEMLIEGGAEVNDRTLSGHSPYSLAVDHQRDDIKELLLAAGAEQSSRQFPTLSGPYLGQTPPGRRPQLFAPDIVSTNWGGHSSIAFSRDGSQALWSAEFMPADSGYSYGRMLSSRLNDGHWTVPEPPSFAIVNGGSDDVPFFSPDGNTLYFISRRSTEPGGPPGKENIWLVEKTTGGWGEPYPAPGEVNAISLHWQFSVTEDGTIYFAGQDEKSLGRDDIYRSKFVNGHYTTPENLGTTINTPGSETCPLIAPDEHYLIFASSGHPDKADWITIYISWKKPDGSWSTPLSTGLGGLCPLLSPEGKYLFYQGSIDGIEGIYWLRADFLEELKPDNL